MRHCFILMLLLNFGLQLHAQSVLVNVLVPPPHSPRLEDYAGSNAGTLIITLTNTTTQSLQVKLKGAITGTNGVRIATRNDYVPTWAIPLAPNEVRFLSYNEIGSFFGERALEFSGADKQELIRTRILPEGDYKFCVDAYDFNQPGYTDDNLLSTQGTPVSCAEFTVTYLEPPIIMQIGTQAGCDVTVQQDDIDAMGASQNLMIGWTIPAGANPIQTRYQFTIVELNPMTREPNDALNSGSTAPFFQTTVNTNFVILDNAAPKLMQGNRYAFRIQAISNGQVYRNNGFSDVCVFNFGVRNTMRGDEAMTLEMVYPPDGGTIPFAQVPVIIKFDPYNDNITQFEVQYQLQTGGHETERNQRVLRWPRGPFRTQQEIVGFADFTQEQSQLIAVNDFSDRGSATGSGLLRGKSYQASISAEAIVVGTASRLRATTRGQFQTGMPIPELMQPANGSEQAPGEIAFQFNTGNAPAQLLPPAHIVQGRRGSGATFFNAPVREKCLFVLARANTFADSTIIDTFTQVIGRDFDLMTENEANIRAALYRDIAHTANITEPGTYYWKVLWLTDPAGNDKRNHYNSSEIFSFRINTGAARDTPGTPQRTTPASCIADCLANLPANRNAATISIGQSLQFGKFNMLVQSLENAAAPYRGRGLIPVPMLGIRLQVQFTGLQANSESVVFAGTAKSVNDAPTLVSEEMARTGGSLLGLTDQQAADINQFIGRGNRLVSVIGGTNPEMGLPLGIDNQINGIRTTIAVIGAHFTAERATLNAVAAFDLPELNGWLSLGATDICFHPMGLNAGEGKLYNPTDKRITFSPDVDLVFTAPNFSQRDSGTYVSWDCRGFKALHVKGEFRFSRNLLIPDETAQRERPEFKVRAKFHTIVTGLNNWILALDMDPFQFTGLDDWAFVARNAVFDFNENLNYPGMVFPQGYPGGARSSWKGFYLRELDVKLPRAFSHARTADRRIAFGARDVLIDRNGFTGKILGRNVVNVQDATVDGWGFAIDTVQLELVANGFRNAGINGKIKLPVAHRPVTYRMILNRNSTGEFGYECVIRPEDTLSMTIVQPAVLTLTPTTRIELNKRPGSAFHALGVIDGAISIQGRVEPVGELNFRGMRIEHLRIENRHPYVTCRAISFASPDKRAAGMPVTLDSFQIVTASEPGIGEFDRSPGFRVGLSMGVFIKLIENNNSFGGSTRLAFMAKVQTGGSTPFGIQFTGIKIQKVTVQGTIGPVSIRGGLDFYAGHSTFGDGVRGTIQATFKPTVSVDAIVQFGKANNQYYFYVDGAARFTPSIPLVPGMSLRGFGGAVYAGMRLDNLPPASGIGESRPADINAIGATLSGGRMVPAPGSGGFTARMYVAAPSGASAYKAMMELHATINSHGGFSQIGVGGDLIVMSETDNPSEAKIGARMALVFDFDRSIFDGNFECWVNVHEVIRGRQANNRAGRIHLYAGPDQWFIKIGTPNPAERIGLTIDLLGRTDVNAYFMVGMNLEPIPDLPIEITSLLRNAPTSFRDPRITQGNGFGFGLEVGRSLPKSHFLFFYAELRYLLGFDISVLHNPGLTCSNTPGRMRGADGWYAQGQLYAYFKGDIGISVDVWFVKGDFPILDIQAAAAVAGGFPNPNWFKGYIGGRYNILGGLIQGECNYEVNVGEPCVTPERNPISDIELVTELFPANGSTDVDVSVWPKAAFNLAPGTENRFQYTDDRGQTKSKQFRISYKEFKLTGPDLLIIQNTYGAPFRGATFRRSQDGNIVGFTPIDRLRPRTSYTLSIKAIVEVFENGAWVTDRNQDGTALEKVYTSSFTTGLYPQQIPAHEITSTYPYRNQRFFLQGECRQGYIKSDRDLRPFFPGGDVKNNAQYFLEIVPALSAGNPVRRPIDVAALRNEIKFPIPPLDNETVYAVRVIAVITPKSNSSTEDKNKNAVPGATQFQANVAQVNNRSLSDWNNGVQEKILYVFYFRTSQFNLLRDKMAAMNQVLGSENRHFDEGDGMLRSFRLTLNGAEKFDAYDAVGEGSIVAGSFDQMQYSGGLVQFKHVAAAIDATRRTQDIFEVYQMAVRKRVINATYSIGAFQYLTPFTPYPLEDRYEMVFNANLLQPLLTENDCLPKPPRPAGATFPITAPGTQRNTTMLDYYGYMEAHKSKTRLANCFAIINATPAYWNAFYYPRSTVAERVRYQDVITRRRFYYPQCVEMRIKASFQLPASCRTDVDRAPEGSSHFLNTVYPPCVEGPR